MIFIFFPLSMIKTCGIGGVSNKRAVLGLHGHKLMIGGGCVRRTRNSFLSVKHWSYGRGMLCMMINTRIARSSRSETIGECHQGSAVWECDNMRLRVVVEKIRWKPAWFVKNESKSCYVCMRIGVRISKCGSAADTIFGKSDLEQL